MFLQMKSYSKQDEEQERCKNALRHLTSALGMSLPSAVVLVNQEKQFV